MMGGRIWVESEPGRGSTFHFTAHFGLGSQNGAGSPPEIPVEVRGARILIVDDNASNRQFLEEILTCGEIQVTTAENAAVALSTLWRGHAEGTPFHLVLVDAGMPKMDGFSFVQRLHQNPELDVHAIMMLASGELAADKLRCQDLGVSALLVKPVRPAELWSTIRNSLAGRPTSQTADSLDSSPSTDLESRVTSAARPCRQSVANPAFHVSDRAKTPAAGSASIGTTTSPPLRILLAEDNLVNQKLLVWMLEKRGHWVRVSSTGREALLEIEAHEFDVVLMDVEMPGMNGLEATAEIRAKETGTGRHLPIVGITAHAMRGDHERCVQAGMDAYLSKPIQRAQLLAALDRIATTSRATEEADLRDRTATGSAADREAAPSPAEPPRAG
jgi:CheY-like chemotaxis protein